MLSDETARERDRLADAARHGDWSTVLRLLERNPGWVNVGRLGGRSGYRPHHQAAWHGADTSLVQRLIDFGAWRTIRTTDGERAYDIANRRGHRHLVEMLVPVVVHPVPAATLAAVQRHFHALIHERAGWLVEEHQLQLPELEPLTEQTEASFWFPVPGMYGGFSYRLQGEDLVTESWSRVVGGSGQRHLVTADGVHLTDEGFV